MKDPEIELLNDLAKKYPADADDFVRPQGGRVRGLGGPGAAG